MAGPPAAAGHRVRGAARARSPTARPGTPSWVCPPSTGTPYASRGPAQPAEDPARRTPRPGRRRASSSPTGSAPIAARSLTLTRTAHQPAQSGSRSTIDGRIASQAAIRSRARAPGRRRRRRSRAAGRQLAQQVAERGSWSRRPGPRSGRSASASARAGVPGDGRAAARRCQPSRAEHALVARPARSASKRSAPAALGVGAGRPHQGRRRCPGRRGRAGSTTSRPPAPPAEVRAVGRPGRAGPRRAPRRRAARATSTTVRGSSSRSSRSCAGEQALLARRRPRAAAGGSADAASSGLLDRQRNGRGGAGTGSHRRAASDDRWPHVMPPAAWSTPQAPQAAQPAFWSAPRIPAAAQQGRDPLGDVADQRRRRRRDAVAAGQRAGHRAGTGPRTGRRPGRSAAPRPRPARRGPRRGRSAGRWRPGCGRTPRPPRPTPPRTRPSAPRPCPASSAGGPRRRGTRRGCRSTVAPAACRSSITARSPGGSICTWIGRPGTASRTARTQRTRLRAPRSGPVVVPVVITICVTPSSRTAASATSASCAGVLAATVAPGAQRLLDGAEPAALVLGVADAGLHDGGGQHVLAVQPGDLLVAARRRRWSGRRTSGGGPARRDRPVSIVAAARPAVARPRTGCPG